ELLAEAEAAWRALDRPLEATRAVLLAGPLLIGTDADRAREVLEQAAMQSEELGVPHLAEKARAVAAGGERLRQGSRGGALHRLTTALRIRLDQPPQHQESCLSVATQHLNRMVAQIQPLHR